MAMETESFNLGISRFHREVEMKKKNEKGKQISDAEKIHQEMEREDGVRERWEEREEEMGVDRENSSGRNVNVEETNQDSPPIDDVCPICFDVFTIPCRSNCGHWFCGSCILQLWMFRSSIQPCKCPLCCCGIVNLKPQISQTGDDSMEVLNKVHQYNGLHITGVSGAFHRVQAFPLLMGRIFRVLIDPDGLRCIHYVARILGLSLGYLYERGEFEFMPTGGLGIQRMFNLGGSILIVLLFSMSVVYRWVLKRRARRLATLQAWDS